MGWGGADWSWSSCGIPGWMDGQIEEWTPIRCIMFANFIISTFPCHSFVRVCPETRFILLRSSSLVNVCSFTTNRWTVGIMIKAGNDMHSWGTGEIIGLLINCLQSLSRLISISSWWTVSLSTRWCGQKTGTRSGNARNLRPINKNDRTLLCD